MNRDELPLIATLTEFIRTDIAAGRDVESLRADDDLLEDSIVDSLGIMRLVAFIEREFGFTVPPEDVTVDNFMTINAIAEYLKPNLSENVE